MTPRVEIKINFTKSSQDVLSAILAAERHGKLAWTAGRVLREMALWTSLESLSYSERKAVLKRLTNFLQNLAEQGILQRRPEVQSIGYGDETGFDYVGKLAARS